MPSSLDDLTRASTTSLLNGRNTTSRNVTAGAHEHRSTAPSRTRCTLVPQTPVAIAHFALAGVDEIEDADAQADVVQDAVRVLLVQLELERAFRGDAERRGHQGDRVLSISAVRLGPIDAGSAGRALMIASWNIEGGD